MATDRERLHPTQVHVWYVELDKGSVDPGFTRTSLRKLYSIRMPLTAQKLLPMNTERSRKKDRRQSRMQRSKDRPRRDDERPTPISVAEGDTEWVCTRFMMILRRGIGTDRSIWDQG